MTWCCVDYYVMDVQCKTWARIEIWQHRAIPSVISVVQCPEDDFRIGLVFVSSADSASIILSRKPSTDETAIGRWKELVGQIVIDQLTPLHHMEKIQSGGMSLYLWPSEIKHCTRYSGSGVGCLLWQVSSWNH